MKFEKADPTIDPNTNRFNTGQGYTFDKNGNLIIDAEHRGFTFNGDNKQTKVVQNGQTGGEYFYDGEGKRVKKQTYDTNGVLQEVTVFVYSSGKLIAEYSTKPPALNPTTSYTATDRLGSPRVITNSLGEVTSRRDFMPFGEQVYSDSTYRTSGLKYNFGDSIRQKFTGYQKDEETGLDFAEARMYQNLHGRFTAVDPLLASGNSANPQTFNRFIYALNNPTSMIDPNGLQAGFWASADAHDKVSGEYLGTGIHYFHSIEEMNSANRGQGSSGIERSSSWAYGDWKPWDRGDFFLWENKTAAKLGADGIATYFSGLSYTDEEWSQLARDWYAGKNLDESSVSRLTGDLYDSTKETNGIVNTGVGLGQLAKRIFGTDLDLTSGNIKQTLNDPVIQAGTLQFGFGFNGKSSSPSGITSLSTMDDAYSSAGTIRNIAGYEVGGTFGRVGNTYNANIFGLYRTSESRGMFSLVRSLQTEARASGATRLNILGTHIINETFFDRANITRASRFGFNYRQVNSRTVLFSGSVR